ncbi:MAG TPA: hypothetical protein VI193_05490 [Acidimicrobiia bacterium]
MADQAYPHLIRIRRWLYLGLGLLFGGFALLAWFEQTRGLLLDDGSGSLTAPWVPIVFLASLVITPLVLFDFVRWLLKGGFGVRTRVISLLGILLAFFGGYFLTWNASICFKEGGVPNHPEPGAGYDEVFGCYGPGDPTLSIAVGLICACIGAYLVWLVLRNRGAMVSQPV